MNNSFETKKKLLTICKKIANKAIKEKEAT